MTVYAPVSRAASATAMLVGSLVLVGWALDIVTLKSLLPAWVTMKANTAVAFVLTGISLRLLQPKVVGLWARWIAHACAFLVALVGLFTLSEYLIGWDLRIDQVLFTEPPEAVGTSSPGRMAPATALNFLLIGVALVLLDAETRRGDSPAELLTLPPAAASLLALTGYAYGVEPLYGIRSPTGMAVHTAATFVVLSVGLLFARPDRGLMTLVSSNTAGGLLTRRVLPAAIAIPVVIGWLRLLGQRAGLYETEFGLSLMVVSSVVVVGALIWWSARSLYRIDAERKRVMEELAEREARLRGLLAAAADAVVIVNAQGRIVFASARTEELFGYTPDELLEKPLETLLPERFRAPHAGRRTGYLAAPRMRPMGAGLDVYGRRKDGSEFPVDVNLSPVNTAEGPLVISIIRDMTESRRREARLRESEEKYRTLVETLEEVVYRVKTTGNDPLAGAVEFVGGRVKAILGYEPDEFVRDAGLWSRIIHPDDVPEIVRVTRELFAGARSLTRYYRVRGKETGEYRWFEDTVVVETDDQGNITGIQGAARDITDRKRVEAELQRQREILYQSEKLAAMGSLLAGVAHELNNPLAVILGQGTLLQKFGEGGALRPRVEKILTAAGRCVRIVKNFLALARQYPPEREAVNLNQVIHETVELLAYPLRVDNIEVVLDLAPNLPALWADPHQLQQVVVNLAINAQQAMRAWPPPRRLTLSTRCDSARERVSLELADTGPGIPPETQARVFEPFFTTKPPDQGTGLGLSLCQGIVEAHEGTIRIESRPGQGAVFRVELPVVEAPRREGLPLPGADSASLIGGKRILVVDDEPEITSLLQDLLGLDGHQVEAAANGVLALAKLRENEYDLILSDLKMPELDGPGLYRELRRHSPDLCRRVIFLTGDALGRETREFLEETGVPCLSKPFTFEEARRVVQRALRSAAGQ